MVQSYLAYVLKIKHLLVALKAPLTTLGERCILIVTLARTLWREARRITYFKGINVALPLWHNPLFPHLMHFLDYYFWEQKGVVV